MRLSLLAAVVFLIWPASTHAATGRVECNSLPSKILAHPVRYCVLLPPGYDAEKTRGFPILYFFHGLGDDEQMFVHSGGWNMVEDLWERKELGEFLIATPAAGATFYINSHDGRVRYEDFLVQEFLPAIEKKFRVRAGRANRAVSGVSMGGYGALHLAFRHPELFSSASAHSAALIEKLPSFLGGSVAQNSPRARVFGGTFGSPPNAAFWERNSPLGIARTASLAGLKIYFDCGNEDDFGFADGAAALDRVLASRKIPHEFHLYPGRHDWQYFATHLPASLQFHSSVFAGRAPAVRAK
ncbi:MAG TPA: alpha/beta hydrolase family protein [Candidatus Acidoferrum sp.]|nr:alpha/beta hydrolase family protein [Candidatus Acidoferrum sp.]